MDKSSEGGFTLLEVIVSMTIMAAMAALIAGGFRLASASIERGEREVRGMARLRAGMDIMTRAIRAADPSTIPVDGKEKKYFVGEAGRLRFLSASPPGGTSAYGYRLLCFRLADAKQARGIAVTDASPFRAEGVAGWEGGGPGRVVLAGARDLAFSYSAGPSKDGEWEWSDGWDSAGKESLPGAVRIEFVTTRDDGTPEKTSVVVPVAAGG